MLSINWEFYFQNSQTPASCSPPPFSRHFCLFWFWATSNFNATRYNCKNQDKPVQKVHKVRYRNAKSIYPFGTFFMHAFVWLGVAFQFSVKSIHCHWKMSYTTVMAKAYQTVWFKHQHSDEFITVFYSLMSVLYISR